MKRPYQIVLLEQGGLLGRTNVLQELLERLVVVAGVLLGHPTGPVDALGPVCPGKGEHPLYEAVGSLTPGLDRALGPEKRPGTDPLGSGQEVALVSLGLSRLVGGPVLGAGGVDAALRLRVDRHHVAVVANLDHPVGPANGHGLAQQVVRHGVVGVLHLYVAVEVDLPGAEAEV